MKALVASFIVTHASLNWQPAGELVPLQSYCVHVGVTTNRTDGSGVASGVRGAREIACAWDRDCLDHAAADHQAGCLSGPIWFCSVKRCSILCISS
jgi:hypothetical protein